MATDYTVLYINTDDYILSEVIGVYNRLHDAVEAVIKAAHYDQDEDGCLRQYRRPTRDYESYSELYELVYNNFILEDYDLYVIRPNVYQ